MTDPQLELDPVDVLAAEFAERMRLGERPSIADYAAKHPELAEDIRELFPTIALMEQAKVRSEESLSARASFASARPDRLGDFRIIQEIGRGGMGIVFEAEQESLKRRVAVKLLPKLSLLSSTHAQRFEREAHTAARLHHSNIVPVFGVGEQDGYHYIVMQLIRGIGLDEVLASLQNETRKNRVTGDLGERAAALIEAKFQKRRVCDAPAASGDAIAEPSPPAYRDTTLLVDTDREIAVGEDDRRDGDEQAKRSAATGTETSAPPPVGGDVVRANKDRWRSVAQLVVQAADALDYAHAHDTLHRDIKPANLLLDAQGVVWIADFGLAKACKDDNLSRTGDVSGTLQYIAPERFRGQADARSDVYSLGLTLCELLTLQPAFDETDRSKLLWKITHTQPLSPKKVDPAIPRDLETIALKSIAQDPAHRYQTAGDLAEDLRRFLDDRPILARRTSVVEHLWRWGRRNPLVAGLASAVIFLLLLVAVVTTAGYLHSQKANRLVRKALEGETTHRKRAEATSTVALDVLDNIYTQLAPGRHAGTSSFTVENSEGNEVEVSLQPVVSERTAVLLEDLLAFYDRLAEQGSDHVQVRMQIAAANYRVGKIRRYLGQFEQAKTAFRRALAIYEQLEENLPGEQDLQTEIANIHNELGALHGVAAEPEEAIKAHHSALEVLLAQQSATTPSDEPSARDRAEVQYELANTYYLLGTIQQRRRDASAPRPDAGPERPSEGHRPPGHVPPDRRGPGPAHGPPHRFPPERGEAPGDGGPPIHPSDRHPPGAKHGRPGPPGRPLDRPPPDGERDSLGPPPPPQRPPLGPRQPDGRRPQRRPVHGPHDGPPARAGPRREDGYLDKAIELLEELCHDHPSEPKYRHLLARCYRDAAGRLDPDRDFDDRMYKSTAILEELVKEFPNVPDYRYDLVEAYAAVRVRGPRLTPEFRSKAEERLKAALRISSRLVTDHPDVPAYTTSHVHVCHKLADVLLRAGELDEAETALRTAVESQSQLVKRFPDAASHRLWLVAFQRSLAGVLRDQGKRRQAKELLQESIAELHALLKDNRQGRELPHIQFLLDECGRNLEDVLAEMRQEETTIDTQPDRASAFGATFRGRT